MYISRLVPIDCKSSFLYFRLITEYCILPLGSPELRENTPAIKSVLMMIIMIMRIMITITIGLC